jgi:hypothetical protein
VELTQDRLVTTRRTCMFIPATQSGLEVTRMVGGA